jgi:hypothetical protein
VREIENHEPCEETPSTSGTRVERRGTCTKSELSDPVKQGSLKLQKLTLISSLFPPPKYPDETTTFHPPILFSLHKHSTPIWYFISLFQTSYLLCFYGWNFTNLWVCFCPISNLSKLREPRMWFAVLKFGFAVLNLESQECLGCGFC